MIDQEVSDILEKLVIAYQALLEQTDFLTTELLKHRLTEFEKKSISLAQLHKKVLAVEEGLEGMEKYLSSTLKDMKSHAIHKHIASNYTIK